MENTAKESRKRVWNCLLPLSIFILGCLLRLICLGTMPGGMHQDESFVAWNAFALLHEGMDSAGHVMPIYLADWGDGHSALYVWILMPLLALNGGHVNAFVARLPQAIVSIFTLAAVYGTIRNLLDRRAALWSMFLLAVCPWHVMMSRWGLDANMAPGFLIFGLYFFVRGLKKEKFLLLSAFFYGLSLYSYAVIWPIVPMMLLAQIGYGLYHKKLQVNRYSLLASGILFVMALPLLLFVLVNSEVLPEIALPFMTIPRMGGYRGGEIAVTPGRMWSNLRAALSLLWHQNTGAPYDVLLPWGMFYDIGRIFMVLGAICLVWQVAKALWKKEYNERFYLLVQLAGGGVVCLLVTAVLHQINALYIPLVLCEAYGVVQLTEWIRRSAKKLAGGVSVVIAGIYLFCLAGFQKDYYTDYRTLTDAYFANGLEQCVDFAMEQCEETGLSAITVEKGAQWPRLLLYTETLPSSYLNSVVYDVAPAPASFRNGDLLIRTRIDYQKIDPESVYIIYFTDKEVFEEGYRLTKFYDWYVAVPAGVALY